MATESNGKSYQRIEISNTTGDQFPGDELVLDDGLHRVQIWYISGGTGSLKFQTRTNASGTWATESSYSEAMAGKRADGWFQGPGRLRLGMENGDSITGTVIGEMRVSRRVDDRLGL